MHLLFFYWLKKFWRLPSRISFEGLCPSYRNVILQQPRGPEVRENSTSACRNQYVVLIFQNLKFGSFHVRVDKTYALPLGQSGQHHGHGDMPVRVRRPVPSRHRISPNFRNQCASRTNSITFALVLVFRYAFIVPFSIHSDTIHGMPSINIIPSSGSTFLCLIWPQIDSSLLKV